MADQPHVAPVPAEIDQARRTSMAAERTWLAWWRTGLAASAGALAVGRVAPQVLQVATWPYVVLGALYGVLAIGLLLAGARRQADLERAMRTGEHRPLPFAPVAVFTAGGVALALLTIALVVAQA